MLTEAVSIIRALLDGGYVNFNQDENEDRVRASFGPNYDRLARVKERYDPENVFHLNQNVTPA